MDKLSSFEANQYATDLSTVLEVNRDRAEDDTAADTGTTAVTSNAMKTVNLKSGVVRHGFCGFGLAAATGTKGMPRRVVIKKANDRRVMVWDAGMDRLLSAIETKRDLTQIGRCILRQISRRAPCPKSVTG